MSLAWCGTTTNHASCNLGPLPLITPLLERMDVAAIIDRHLPPDPQLEFSHGRVLSLLLAARLCQPTALVNVARWAADSGAEFLWDIPAAKLNDDRLGRALDALFTQRHSILASVAAHVLHTFDLPKERLHYDTTHLLLYGAYDTSQPRPDTLPLPPATGSANYPPAHISHGYAERDTKMIHVGLCSVVDELGAVPIFGHTLDGNHNGKTGIAQQFQLLEDYLQPDPLLLLSDRGTYSVGHVARLHRAGHHVLCSVPWKDFQAVYDRQRDQLHWRRASYLSLEQQRRRDTDSALPREHYDLAVLRHELTDPGTGQTIPCRLLFVFSTADQKVCQQHRTKAISRIRQGLEQLVASVARGGRCTDAASIQRRLAKLLGQRAAAQFFRWELVPLTEQERAALPPPARGCRRPTHRFVFTFDEQAAQADARYDGLSVLLTTAPRTQSADRLFSQFKQQGFVELAHHQWKTPLAVHPLFLKSPSRIEALVYLLKIALTAYHVLQRQYRQAVPADEPVAEQRLTTESMLRVFASCVLIKEPSRLGLVIRPPYLTARQRQLLNRLGYPTPAQLLAGRLPRLPSD